MLSEKFLTEDEICVSILLLDIENINDDDDEYSEMDGVCYVMYSSQLKSWCTNYFYEQYLPRYFKLNRRK